MTDRSLAYDLALPYALDLLDVRALPRLHLGVQFFTQQERLFSLTPVLDTGADVSAFDGSFALAAGWSIESIVDQAIDSQLIRGISAGPAVRGYLHEVVCFVGESRRFAELRTRVLITPPNSLAFPILGRHDFFEQVDVTFAELDKRLYLRFRNPTAFHEFR